MTAPAGEAPRLPERAYAVPAPGRRAVRAAGRSLAVAVALLLAWRVLVAGVAALLEGSAAADPERAPLETESPDAQWRDRIARNPADAAALTLLALDLERQGRSDEAREAMRTALRLAPSSEQTLVQAAGFHLRAGEEARALTILRRAIDLYPAVLAQVSPVLVGLMDAGRGESFFAGIARDNPGWWPAFFDQACRRTTRLAALQRVFAVRASAGHASEGERRCMIDRLQRANQWPAAYQAWLNSLPRERRQRVPYVFNGDFESPITNLGFDWIAQIRDGVAATAQPADGAGGRYALRVEFVNKRWTAAPVQQHMLLFPGRYAFEGRGRADGLDTWLGVQWGLYCQAEDGRAQRQLARSDRFLGSTEWEAFRAEFAVGGDCPVQVLRLELANPRRDADAPGAVAARLRGTVWFDDLRVRRLD